MQKKINLTNCDKEPIQIPGSIQPHGYLLAFSTDWELMYWSENFPSVLGRDLYEEDVNSASEILDSKALHLIKNKVQKLSGSNSIAYCEKLKLMSSDKLFEVSIHKSDKLVIVELEETNSSFNFEKLDLSRILSDRLEKIGSFEDLVKLATRHVFALTNFDRVMVYKFSQDGSGEVVAETTKPGVDSFLGLHFPAADIPAQARRLYSINLIRIISDVNYNSIPISQASAVDSQPIDLSFSYLRSVSPIHIEYLKNMGVQASCSISVMVDEKLWGLIACHNYSTKYFNLSERVALQHYGKNLSWILDSNLQKSYDYKREVVKSLQNDFVSSIAEKGDLLDLAHFKDALLELIPSDELALIINENIQIANGTLDNNTIKKIVSFLKLKAQKDTFHSNHLAKDIEDFESWGIDYCGLLAIPASTDSDDFLIFLRKEHVANVFWAGNPEKRIEFGPNGPRLTPRKSFEEWIEKVKDQSEAWTTTEQQIAESLRSTLVEVVLKLSNVSTVERKKLIQKQELLIAELNHRVRNILALIKGVIAQSAGEIANSKEVEDILGRITSLARAHDQLTKKSWGAGSIKEVLFEEINAYLRDGKNRIRVVGPDCLFIPEAISTLALVMHELTTNSVKYGALCSGAGYVTFEIQPKADEVLIKWTDHNGPVVAPPTKRGFGSTIIEKSIPHDLNGTADVEFKSEGYSATFSIPKIYIHDIVEAQPELVDGKDGEPLMESISQEAQKIKEEVVKGKEILLVEDNLLIALDAQQLLEDMGAKKIHSASSVNRALEVIQESAIDFAVLDINLGNETSLQIADKLKSEGIPFLFASGYDSKDILDNSHSGTPIVRKPYSSEDLVSGISLLFS